MAYAKLLQYKSVEDLLKEEFEWYVSKESVSGRFEAYFDKDILNEIAECRGIVDKPKEKGDAE